MEMEASTYWEHFALLLMHGKQLCCLVEEYVGDSVPDVEPDGGKGIDKLVILAVN